jgi:hypothetical protein
MSKPDTKAARARAEHYADSTDVISLCDRIDALEAAITQALSLIENDAQDMAIVTLRAALAIPEGP